MRNPELLLTGRKFDNEKYGSEKASSTLSLKLSLYQIVMKTIHGSESHSRYFLSPLYLVSVSHLYEERGTRCCPRGFEESPGAGIGIRVTTYRYFIPSLPPRLQIDRSSSSSSLLQMHNSGGERKRDEEGGIARARKMMKSFSPPLPPQERGIPRTSLARTHAFGLEEGFAN